MVSAQTVLYVDSAAAGANNGNNWANAYTNLQSALDRAHLPANGTTNFEIRIAKGTYLPSKKHGNYYTYVLSRGGIKIIGGYNAATGIRNHLANPSILDGATEALAFNDIQFSRSEHVMVIAGIPSNAETIELDGLKFAGGSGANYPADDHISFSINGKEIVPSRGGGLYLNEVEVTTSIKNCTFYKNYGSQGGAIYNLKSNLLLSNCVFLENGVFLQCAGFTCFGAVLVTAGAAIFNENGKLLVQNSIFSLNQTAGTNGALTSTGNSANVEVNQCLFYKNSSINTAAASAMQGTLKIINSVFALHTSNSGFGAVRGANVEIANSIFWGHNYNIEIGVPIADNVVVTNSIVEGGFIGAANTDANPMLVNIDDAVGPDKIWGTSDDGLKTIFGSPAINKGNNAKIASSITTDFAGNARIVDVTVDIGAYEGGACPQSDVLYVDANVSSSGNGSSWQLALKTLDEALNLANSCNTIAAIKVAGGTYYPTGKQSGTDLNKSFVINRGNLKLEGGYNATTNTRNPKANPSVLSGNIGSSSSNTDNSYHVMTIVGLNAQADSVVVDGFTIEGGNANADGNPGVNGVIVHQGHGGGIFIKDCSNGQKLALRNLTFINNRAKRFGGGLHIINSSPLIDRCIFSLNQSEGISDTGGAGLATETNGSPKIVNSVFINNSTESLGGAVFNSSTTPSIINCTFFNNGAAYGGLAIYNQQGAILTLSNTIIWNSGTSNSLITNNYSAVNATYSNIRQLTGVYAGAGNKNEDPKFINAADPDGADNILGTADDGLRLQVSSTSINAGNNASAAGIEVDILGKPRIFDTRVDLGAYENQTVTTLPVTFGKFTATLQNNRVKLDWNTLSETNNEAFIIYRSKDGKNYTEVAQIPSKGSNANSYTAYDNNPSNGVNYYRLKQRDYDGTVTELGDDAINFSLADEEVKVWPIPADKWLKLSFTAGKYQNLKLMDISGKKFQERNIAIAQSEMELDLSNYPKGVYLVELIGNHGKHVIKVLK